MACEGCPGLAALPAAHALESAVSLKEEQILEPLYRMLINSAS